MSLCNGLGHKVLKHCLLAMYFSRLQPPKGFHSGRQLVPACVCQVLASAGHECGVKVLERQPFCILTHRARTRCIASQLCSTCVQAVYTQQVLKRCCTYKHVCIRLSWSVCVYSNIQTRDITQGFAHAPPPCMVHACITCNASPSSARTPSPALGFICAPCHASSSSWPPP